MAVDEAARRRLDIVLESACRHPEDFTSLATILRDAAYHLTVIVMAVPAPLSRLGTLVRFHRDLPEARSRGLPLRLTPPKVHDDSYEGLGKAVEWLNRTGNSDRLIILRRGNLVSYLQEPRGTEGSITEAFIKERARPLTPEERRLAIQDLDKLKDTPEASEHLDQIEQLLNPLLFPTLDQNTTNYPRLRVLKFHEDSGKDSGDDEVATQRVRLFVD